MQRGIDVKIAVLGTGRVGGALGCRWAEAGHDVVFGSRNPEQEKTQALLQQCGGKARAASIEEAGAHGDIIVYAAPWPNAKSILESIGGAAGKIIVDCTNPLNASFDGLDLGFTESAAERIAGWAPEAQVVKAFNTVSSATMADPDYDGQSAALFICGDGDDVKAAVKKLADELGFDTIDAGPLRNARYLEPFAMLYIHLAMNGWGSNCAFKVLKREKKSS